MPPIFPGKENMGFLNDAVKAAGSFLASYGGQWLKIYQTGESAGFIGSVVGALVILFIYGLIKSARLKAGFFAAGGGGTGSVPRPRGRACPGSGPAAGRRSGPPIPPPGIKLPGKSPGAERMAAGFDIAFGDDTACFGRWTAERRRAGSMETPPVFRPPVRTR